MFVLYCSRPNFVLYTHTHPSPSISLPGGRRSTIFPRDVIKTLSSTEHYKTALQATYAISIAIRSSSADKTVAAAAAVVWPFL